MVLSPAHHRRLYCLQLLQDIKERKILLDPASAPALQLTALRMQATLGEYDPKQHGQGYTHKYLDLLYTDENDIVCLYTSVTVKPYDTVPFVCCSLLMQRTN